MRVMISGASGLIGTGLTTAWQARDHEVIRLVRRAPRSSDEITWDPGRGDLDLEPAGELDVVVHLSGESVAGGPWTKARKQRIFDSRVRSTRLLADRLAGRERRPRAFVCASAIGFYGNSGDAERREGDPPGSGFLAEVCQEWERAADSARKASIRVVHARFGIVLSTQGGTLAAMLPIFKLGLGGRLGGGGQWVTWVALDDAVAAIDHVVRADSIIGPVNVCSPQPVTNAEFTAALGAVLARPTALRAPKFALRWLLGSMADELLLSSTRAKPHGLERSGFRFRHPGIRDALADLLERGS